MEMQPTPPQPPQWVTALCGFGRRVQANGENRALYKLPTTRPYFLFCKSPAERVSATPTVVERCPAGWAGHLCGIQTHFATGRVQMPRPGAPWRTLSTAASAAGRQEMTYPSSAATRNMHTSGVWSG